MLFVYKKALIFVLLMFLVVYGVYALATNLMGKMAETEEDCEDDKYCQYKHEASNENKNSTTVLYIIQFWLGFAFSIIWIITLRFIKFKGI